MHPSTDFAVPVFYTRERRREEKAVTYLFRVTLRTLGRLDGHTWQGWAEDAEDAGRRALDDARQRWRGYGFAITSNVQVNT